MNACRAIGQQLLQQAPHPHKAPCKLKAECRWWEQSCSSTNPNPPFPNIPSPTHLVAAR